MSPCRTKAIRRPSAEAEGARASSAGGVTACRPLPSAFITQICSFPATPLALEKTITPGVLAADAVAATTPANATSERALVIDQIILHKC
jgi:hypothetical protein